MSATVERPANTTADESLVRVERRGPVVHLTLNRATRYNVLSAATITALRAMLEHLALDREVHVVVIAAEGRAFSAGHDLTEMGPDAGIEDMRTLFTACSELMLTIQHLPQPVIARVQGIATAAGCQLVAMCDLAVASSNARFAVSGINLGLFCATPAVALSRNILQKQAMEMLLTGDFIDAQTARERGLVNRVVPPEALDAEIEKLAILQTLERTRGNKRKAASILGVYRPTLYNKLKKYNLLETSERTPKANAQLATPPVPPAPSFAEPKKLEN